MVAEPAPTRQATTICKLKKRNWMWRQNTEKFLMKKTKRVPCETHCTHCKTGQVVLISHLLKSLNFTGMCFLASSKDSFSFVFWVTNSFTFASKERPAIQEVSSTSRQVVNNKSELLNPHYSLRFNLVPYFFSIIANKIFCSAGCAVLLKLTRK